MVADRPDVLAYVSEPLTAPVKNDRNPQTFVDNIFFAKPGDYRKATQRVYHQPNAATTIDLPIAP